jgi:hypothetical protein
MPRYPLVLLLMLGCSHNGTPASPVSTTRAEGPEIAASNRPFPPDAPAGDVRLATMGLTPLADGRRAVHVRMTGTNRSNDPWTIRQAEQRMELSTREQSFATSPSGDAVEVVEVPPAETSAVDLYFPLPLRLQNARAMEPFAVVWTIRVGPLVFTELTSFDGFPIASREVTEPTSGDPFNTPQSNARVPSAGTP